MPQGEHRGRCFSPPRLIAVYPCSKTPQPVRSFTTVPSLTDETAFHGSRHCRFRFSTSSETHLPGMTPTIIQWLGIPQIRSKHCQYVVVRFHRGRKLSSSFHAVSATWEALLARSWERAEKGYSISFQRKNLQTSRWSARIFSLKGEHPSTSSARDGFNEQAKLR